MKEKSLEEIRAFFANDKYATETTGAEIVEARPGYAKVRLTIDGRHINGLGYVMGGVYFTLADFSLAVAINHFFDEEHTVALTSQVEYMKGVTEGTLYAQTQIDRDTRKIVFATTDVTDEDGNLLVKVVSSNYKLPKKA